MTGASGFIGRHVLAQLSSRQVDIIAATRTLTKLEEWRDRAEVVELDIAQPSSDQLDVLARCDVLIHLAWDGLPYYQSLSHFEVELPRQYGFLKSLLMRGSPAVLVAGTCLEYGLQSGELPEDALVRPVTPYGFAKDALRQQLEFLGRDHPFALTWARLFYTYGDGQRTSALYPQLAAAASRGDNTFDMSSGEQLRDYLPVEEVARLIVDLALRRANAGVVNVCAGKAIAVRQLVEGWIAENGWKLRLNLGRYPQPDYEPLAFWGARAKLDALVGQA